MPRLCRSNRAVPISASSAFTRWVTLDCTVLSSSAARFELGTLDGMIGCVAADMGVTMLPRAVVGKNETVSIHKLSIAQSRVDTLFIQRRSAHQYSALQGFNACLTKNGEFIAA